MAEIALGKCWTVKALKETIENATPGAMSSHAPEPNEHYDAFLQQMRGRQLIMRDAAGNETARVKLGAAESGKHPEPE
ncbi:hypothetical protein P6166_02390 [Stenotrophomonas sp. HITSZ_GD]|uniref:hypothetical protein n=1 Tax=Stenotrophomonas sp. HITSZ_GD TaxID=3037248 RepID=UPI00240E29C2|nr:hypothetical protein [Stenotrophomonas sp. HITSZ_GD]MDG2524207.1 hypothetical protein [Stenotrophomonas sp. HITSZ_GD]